MLTEYIQNAMRLAHYELMENGRFFGTIPGCKGLYAEGKTLEQCREELQSTLKIGCCSVCNWDTTAGA